MQDTNNDSDGDRGCFCYAYKIYKSDIIDLKSVFPSSHVKVEYEDCDIFFLIMKTSLCNVHVYPLTPHFYIVKLGFTGVYIIFLFLLLNIDCGYLLEPPH